MDEIETDNKDEQLGGKNPGQRDASRILVNIQIGQLIVSFASLIVQLIH